jgi:hypothetical protein
MAKQKHQEVHNPGKGSTEEDLPHRFALNSITKGDPLQRTMNNYAKVTPGLDQGTPDIFGTGGSQ